MFKRIRRTRTECAEHSFKAVNLSCRLIQLPNSAVKYCAAKNCKRINRVNNTVAVHIRTLYLFGCECGNTHCPAQCKQCIRSFDNAVAVNIACRTGLGM